VNGEWVSIFVGDDHPLLQLKQALDWEAIKTEMSNRWRAAGRHVSAGGRGRYWPVHFYAPLLVLMWVKAYHSRQMEEYISESVVAWRFLEFEDGQLEQIRDHSSIARAEADLGAEGKAAINALIIKTAEELNFTNRKTLSADTTVQEPAIGHPNEPGILKGWAERIERSLKKLKAGGVKAAQRGIEKTKELYRKVKAHHLFAQTKAEKQKLLEQIVRQSEELMEQTKEVIKQVSARCGRIKQRAKAKLEAMVEVARRLLPQIKQWLKTGVVATEKIIHAGITEARAIPKGQGRVKFGMKWLISRLKGGSLFGQRVAPRADENKMPEQALQNYREQFGPQATPERFIYDRGASLPAAAAKLQAEGVKLVGIPPRGQGEWLVGEKEQKIVKSERGKTEGSIGRLKSRKYGFSHRQERSLKTQEAVGQRVIVSVNLNTLMRDLVKQAKAASLAQG
jgi:tellurite resistance protein